MVKDFSMGGPLKSGNVVDWKPEELVRTQPLVFTDQLLLKDFLTKFKYFTKNNTQRFSPTNSVSSLLFKPVGSKENSFLVQYNSNGFISSNVAADWRTWIDINFCGSSPLWNVIKWFDNRQKLWPYLGWLLWFAQREHIGAFVLSEVKALPTYWAYWHCGNPDLHTMW